MPSYVTRAHPKDSFTLNFWAHSNNWKSMTGHQMAGNYYLGGVGVFYNDGVFTPQIAAFWDRESGWIGTINQDGNIISQRMFDEETVFDQVLTNSNRSIYLLDNKNHKIIILDTDLVKVDEIILENIIKQIEVAPDNSIYALTLEDHILVYKQGCDDDPENLGGLGFNACWNKIHIKKDGTLVRAQVDDNFPILSDCSGNVYWIYGNNIYKNGVIFYHLVPSRRGMSMDLEDDIYVFYGNGRLVKIDKDGKTVFDTIAHSMDEIPNEKTSISISRQYENGTYRDYLWVVMEDRNYILKIDTLTGKMVKCVQVPMLVDLERYSERIDISKFKLKGTGDMTGYQLAKRRICDIKKSIQVKLMLKDPNCEAFGIPIELNYDVNNLTSGWHMFTLIFNKEAGNINFYVDGLLVETTENDYVDYEVYYKYYSPFLIGADSGKHQALEIENQVKNPSYFSGKIQDVKLLEGVIDPKILKGDSLFSIKSDPVFCIFPLKQPLQLWETVDKFLVNEKPYRTNRFKVESEFLNNLPPTCSSLIKNKILEENNVNSSMVLFFED